MVEVSQLSPPIVPRKVSSPIAPCTWSSSGSFRLHCAMHLHLICHSTGVLLGLNSQLSLDLYRTLLMQVSLNL